MSVTSLFHDLISRFVNQSLFIIHSINLTSSESLPYLTNSVSFELQYIFSDISNIHLRVVLWCISSFRKIFPFYPRFVKKWIVSWLTALGNWKYNMYTLANILITWLHCIQHIQLISIILKISNASCEVYCWMFLSTPIIIRIIILVFECNHQYHIEYIYIVDPQLMLRWFEYLTSSTSLEDVLNIVDILSWHWDDLNILFILSCYWDDSICLWFDEIVTKFLITLVNVLASSFEWSSCSCLRMVIIWHPSHVLSLSDQLIT